MPRPIVVAVLMLAVTRTPVKAQGNDLWYVLRIGGTPVGWFHEVRAGSDSGITLGTTLRLVLNRLGSRVVMQIAERSLEAPAGDFIRADLTMLLSQQASELHARLNGDTLRVRTSAGAKEFVRSLPSGGALIGPAAAARLTAASLRTPGDSIQYRIFYSPVGAPTTVTRRLAARDTVAVAGRPVAARRIVERTPASPTAITLWIDANGRTLRTAYDSPFGRTETELADSATAASADAGGVLSDEQYARTLVRTGIKLPQARRIELLRLVLTTDSSTAWPPLEGPGQRVLDQAPGRLTLELTRRRPPPGVHPYPVAPTAATREYLQANAYIQSDDSLVRDIARQAARGERDAWRAALALERWVADSMRFDLGVAFAPSVEVIRQRRGTCVAYATVLAAMTRSLGIPSRIAFGYVYVNGIFGGHAWTEVLIADAWIAVDGAIVADGPADAARFAFAWGSLAGGPGEFTHGPGARLYNGLGARVLAYQLTGESRVTVGNGAPPYRIDGNQYSNEAFGLAFTRPPEYRFAALDETWPSMTVAGVDGPDRRVRLRSSYRDPWMTPSEDARTRLAADSLAGPITELQVAGGPAWMRATSEMAVLALPYGGETIIVEASGSGAAALLTWIARTIRIGKETWR